MALIFFVILVPMYPPDYAALAIFRVSTTKQNDRIPQLPRTKNYASVLTSSYSFISHNRMKIIKSEKHASCNERLLKSIRILIRNFSINIQNQYANA